MTPLNIHQKNLMNEADLYFSIGFDAVAFHSFMAPS